MQHFITLIGLLTCMIFKSVADSFNIMILNRKQNTLGMESARTALKYVRNNPRWDVQLDNVINVECSTCDDEMFFEMACGVYNKEVQRGKGPHLIIDLTHCKHVNLGAHKFIQSIALPAISTSHETSDIKKWLAETRTSRFHLQFLHSQSMIPQIVRILTLSKQLTSTAVLYDETFGKVLKSESLLRDISVRQLFVNVEDTADLRPLMVELRALDIFNYFVLGSLSTIESVLDSADCSTYYEKKFAWFVVTQESGKLKYSCRNLTHLFIKPNPRSVNQKTYSSMKSVYAWKSHSDIATAFYFNVVAKSLLAFRLFLASNKWFTANYSHSLCNYENKDIAHSNGISIDFVKYFRQIIEPVIFAPLHVHSSGRGYLDFMMSLEMVTICGDQEDVEHLGMWRPGTEQNVIMKTPNASSSQVIYKVVTVLHQPFMRRTIDASGNANYTGFLMDLINDISQIVGFKYEVYLAPDNSFGAMDEKGNWRGLIKELIDKRADIGLGPLSISAERQSVVEFTVPYYDFVGMAILMKKHSPKTTHFKFLTAMDGEIWLCIVITYTFASVLLWVFSHFNPNSFFTNSSANIKGETITLKDCLWLCMTSLTPQGGGSVPNSLSGYIILGTWWLFGFVIISSFTANLAAFLTMSRLDTRITSLSDLSRQTGIQYAPIQGSADMAYFERMASIEQRFHEKWKNMTFREPLSDQERAMFAVWEYPISDKFSRLWRSMKKAGLPLNIDEAKERVLASKSPTEGFAYIGGGTMLRYLCLVDCNLQIIGEEFAKLPFGIALQKKSPLRDSLNKAIIHLLNQRRLEKLKEVWFDENPDRKNCEQHTNLVNEGYTYISDIGGVYTLIVIGFVLACFILIFEYYEPKTQQSIPAKSTHFSNQEEYFAKY